VVLSTLMLIAETTAETVVEETPKNPILPIASELFWGAVCFFGLWALMKFWLVKPIVATMDERAAKVRDDLEQAERAEAELETAIDQYQAGLASAKAEATRTIEDARAQADTYRAEVLARAEAEVAALRSAAAEDVAEKKATALAQLRDGVADIAVSAASVVVQKPLDRDGQLQVIEDYVNRAGSQS
jgi:F-type H+-transporting ATPase subunit b